MCVCVCLCVFLCVCVFVWVCESLHVGVNDHAFMSVFLNANVPVFVRLRLCMRVFVCVDLLRVYESICASVSECLCVYMHVHACVCVCVCVCRRVGSLSQGHYRVSFHASGCVCVCA